MTLSPNPNAPAARIVSPLNPPPGPPTDEHGHFIPMSQWDPNHWPSHIHPPRATSKRELKG